MPSSARASTQEPVATGAGKIKSQRAPGATPKGKRHATPTKTTGQRAASSSGGTSRTTTSGGGSSSSRAAKHHPPPAKVEPARPARPRSAEWDISTVHTILAGVDALKQRQKVDAEAAVKAEVQAAIQAAKRGLASAKKEVADSQGGAAAAAEAAAEARQSLAAAERSWRKACELEATARREADEAEAARIREEKVASAARWREECGLLSAVDTRTDWRAKLEAATGNAATTKTAVAAAAAHTAAQQAACTEARAQSQARDDDATAAQARVASANASVAKATKKLARANAAAMEQQGRAQGDAGAGRAMAPATSRPGSRATWVDWRDAEVQAIVDRRDQRRAEIYALNALLMRALTGAENDV